MAVRVVVLKRARLLLFVWRLRARPSGYGMYLSDDLLRGAPTRACGQASTASVWRLKRKNDFSKSANSHTGNRKNSWYRSDGYFRISIPRMTGKVAWFRPWLIKFTVSGACVHKTIFELFILTDETWICAAVRPSKNKAEFQMLMC